MSDTALAPEAAVHLAHEAYVDAINSNDVDRFLDGTWRVCRDIWATAR